MRITNSIMMNNCLSNINRNKNEYDRLNTQLSTQCKIQKPSDDPIIAIRALRYRYTTAEITQYLDRNVTDAEGWLEATEDTLADTVGLLQDVVYYLEQGSNGTNDLSNRQTVLTTLKAYRDQMYADANDEYSGRTLFTGFKTNDTMTYTLDDNDKTYYIKQKISKSDVEDVEVFKSNLDTSALNSTSISTSLTDADDPKYRPSVNYLHRIRLSYDEIENCETTINLYDSAGTKTQITLNSYGIDDARSFQNPESPSIGSYVVKETGEIFLTNEDYQKFVNADSADIGYVKQGFRRGDLKPEQYYDCVDITGVYKEAFATARKDVSNVSKDDNQITSEVVADLIKNFTGKTATDIKNYCDSNPDKTIRYTFNPEQYIKYTVNFNQDLKLNTLGRDVYTYDLGRDLDDLINIVSKVDDVESEIKRLESIRANLDETTKPTEIKSLDAVLEVKNQELDSITALMQKGFEHGLTKYNAHFHNVSVEKSDVGARMKRLELSKSRLTSHETVVTELMTKNEKVDTTKVAVQMAAASSVYDASLASAAKIIQKTLLDFI